jgi:hypothetical protein
MKKGAKPARKKTDKKTPPASKLPAKPPAPAAKPAAKATPPGAATRPPARADRAAVEAARYTPRPVQSTGWPPFRYPPQ